MHIGNARGGAIGDCLAEIMKWAGYDVQREFYVNDAGNQIEKFGKSLNLRFMQICNGKGQAVIENAAEIFKIYAKLSITILKISQCLKMFTLEWILLNMHTTTSKKTAHHFPTKAKISAKNTYGFRSS